jgi:hypothetical protein
MHEFVKSDLTLERFIELSRMPGFDINAKVSKMLIISWLILNKNLRVVNYILDNEIGNNLDINDEDYMGRTPLTWAIQLNNPVLVNKMMRFKDIVIPESAVIFARNQLLKFDNPSNDSERNQRQINEAIPNYRNNIVSIIEMVDSFSIKKRQRGGYYYKLVKYQNKIIQNYQI